MPQGSILGPLLFIIYINDIPNASQLFNFISYADDTTLFVSLTHNNDNITNELSPNSLTLNNEINLVTDWLSINKLSLNASKTKCMTFHSKKKMIHLPSLIIGNTEIEHVENFPFLGIIINKNLNWDSHINHIARKISKTIGILNRLKRTLPSYTLKTIYNSLINSHINYGILCWGYKSNKILKLQKKAVRIISNSKFNAHTQPLFKNLKILTVNDILTRKIYKFHYRMSHDNLPNYFMSTSYVNIQHNTYNTRNTHYIVPRIRLKASEYNLRYQLPIELNKNITSITDKITTHSEFGYSLYIKNHFLNNYQEICHLDSCYVCGCS